MKLIRSSVNSNACQRTLLLLIIFSECSSAKFWRTTERFEFHVTFLLIALPYTEREETFSFSFFGGGVHLHVSHDQASSYYTKPYITTSRTILHINISFPLTRHGHVLSASSSMPSSQNSTAIVVP